VWAIVGGALDHIVPAGHRIGLVIGGADGFWFTVDLAGTSVKLPVAR